MLSEQDISESVQGKLLMTLLCPPFLNHWKTVNAYPYYIMLLCIKEVQVCQLVQTHVVPSALESNK